MDLVRQDPARRGCPRGRWRLADLRAALPALAAYSLPGVGRLLARLGVRLKRGRLRVHSPDPAYAAKRDKIARLLALARARPDRVTLVYADEVSCHRQPTLADTWAPVGTEPTADLSHRANTRWRAVGGLDAATGRVVWRGGSKAGVAQQRRFLRDLRAAYPDRVLLLVWDNWPVHAHPEVLAEARRLRIALYRLPTYAPWLNPIEKLWRKLKQDVLHHHRLADAWPELKARIAALLDGFAHGSDDLLRYVGLRTD